jgi:hypothetical protein
MLVVLENQAVGHVDVALGLVGLAVLAQLLGGLDLPFGAVAVGGLAVEMLETLLQFGQQFSGFGLGRLGHGRSGQQGGSNGDDGKGTGHDVVSSWGVGKLTDRHADAGRKVSVRLGGKIEPGHGFADFLHPDHVGGALLAAEIEVIVGFPAALLREVSPPLGLDGGAPFDGGQIGHLAAQRFQVAGFAGGVGIPVAVLRADR